MAIRHHSITSALYPIRDGASSGDRLIIGRADLFFRHILLLTDKMLMPRVGILFQRFRLFSEGVYAFRHLYLEHFTFPDPCRDHPSDGISMGKVIFILTLRQGDFFHTVTSPGCQAETLRTGIRLDSGDNSKDIFGYSPTIPQADTSPRGDFCPPQAPTCHQSSAVAHD